MVQAKLAIVFTYFFPLFLLYGDEENDILLPQLSKRIGMLKKIRKHLPDLKFRTIVNEFFSSKLIYCMTVWYGVWGMPYYNVKGRNNNINGNIWHMLSVPYDTDNIC